MCEQHDPCNHSKAQWGLRVYLSTNDNNKSVGLLINKD